MLPLPQLLPRHAVHAEHAAAADAALPLLMLREEQRAAAFMPPYYASERTRSHDGCRGQPPPDAPH